ncbi:ribonuclease HIII [Halobacillus ihumii]|uniref:ribonuclease HIII n=1 Tax=Halobacillus ihumii TaxID=2686092 RepID=UPI0013D049BD|nr:ribonuclease HIII [Halobacillus ihumii]
MSQVVLTLPKEKLQEMQSYYKQSLKATPQNAAFAAKTPNCTITAYNSGKVLFQGKAPEQESHKWGNSTVQNSSKKSVPKPTHRFHPDKALFAQSHIGSDEAGTGDFFGPITVAAAYVKDHQIGQLKAIGVKDSKHLSDKQITHIAKQIVEMNIPYSLLRLDNMKYNQWQEKGWTQGKMKTMLHHKALETLLAKIAPEQPAILVDQFSQPDVYAKHLKSECKQLQRDIFFMTKAESYSTSVAVASIIARSSFVKAMNQIEMDTGLPVPKGASGAVDKAAAKIITIYGEDKLREIAKIHFATLQKARKLT